MNNRIILLSVLIISALVVAAPARAQFFYMEDENIGKEAQNFELKRVNKESIALKEYLGGQKGIIFFWATWCPHCRVQLKELSAKKDEIEQGKIKVVLIDVGEDEPIVDSFIKKSGLPYDVFLDVDSAVSNGYGIVGVPTYYFVDEKGIVRAVDHTLPEDLNKPFQEI